MILSKGFVIIRVKSITDFVSLTSKENLVQNIKSILENIKEVFPPKSKRFIEIEL